MRSIKPESMRWFWATFIECFRRERQLWPSPVTMNVPEKFFHSKGREAKIYSISFDSSYFFSSWLTVNCLKPQISGSWLADGFVRLCWYCLWGHRSVSYSPHAGNDATNILSIGPIPPAAHQSSNVGIQLCSFFPVWQSEMESERAHLISCSTPSLPDQRGCTAEYTATCTKCFLGSLS